MMPSKEVPTEFPPIDFENKEGHQHGECIPGIMEMLQLGPVERRSWKRNAEMTIGDSWHEHVKVVDEEMDAADLEGYCAHSRPYNLAHHEPGDLSKFTRVLVYLDSHTRGIGTDKLKNMDRLFGIMEAKVSCTAIASARLKTAKNSLDIEVERLDQNITISTASDAHDGTEARELSRLRELCVEMETQLQKHENDLGSVQDEFAGALLFTVIDLWNDKPKDCNHDESLQKELRFANHTIRQSSDKIAEQYASIANLSLELQVAEKIASEQEEILKVKQRDLEKRYYDNVQKRVESRVADEKLKVTERLRTAENKAQQYDKMMEKIKMLQTRVAQHEKETVINRQTTSDLERQLKIRDEEAYLLREGYDQLSTDIRTLQLENSTLQIELSDLNTDHEKLKKDQEALLEKLRLANTAENSTQSHSQAGEVVPVTWVDRRPAELQHLHGLVSMWQNTLDAAIAKKEQSLALEAAMDIKVREAKAQLKHLKNPIKSQKQQKQSSCPKPVQNAGNHLTAMPRIVSATPVDGPRPVEPPHLRSKPLAGKEEFPALGSPVKFVQRGDSANVWKTLRLVDAAKAKKLEDQTQ